MRATCVALLLASAQGAVIGIDLGSRFLKVGIIQPGTGIELVLNEQPQLVNFGDYDKRTPLLQMCYQNASVSADLIAALVAAGAGA